MTTSSPSVLFLDDTGTALHFSGACSGEMHSSTTDDSAVRTVPSEPVAVSLFDQIFVETI